MAGLLSTGRNELAQADDASKQATGLANAMAASNANITMAKRNAKSTAMGQGLGGLASLGLSQAPGLLSSGGGFAASALPAATTGGAGAILGSAGEAAVTPALASLGGEAAGAAGAGAAGAGLGATAAAAIPFVGWAAAAGLLAYSLFG